MNKHPKEIFVKCFKHDGSLHRVWRRSFLIENNEKYFIIASKKAIVSEGNGRQWIAKEPAITIFPKDKWFNVIAMLKDPYVAYYVNLASPPIYDGGVIKYVDYDLDIKLNFNNEIKLIDINEYKSHKKKLHYNEDIEKIIMNTVEQIEKMMEKREFPFDDLKIIDLYYDFLEKQL